MKRNIIGATVGSPLPKSNLMQTDPTKGDYVKGKPEFLKQIQENGGGLSAEAVTLLLTILGESLYASDQSGNIRKLEKALLGGVQPDPEPEQPETMQTVTAALGAARLGMMRLGVRYN